jgi:hypothetical protein
MIKGGRLLDMSTLEGDASAAWSALQSIWSDLAWENTVYSHGAFHHVAVLGSASVVRVSFATDHQARIARQSAVLHTMSASQPESRNCFEPPPMTPGQRWHAPSLRESMARIGHGMRSDTISPAFSMISGPCISLHRVFLPYVHGAVGRPGPNLLHRLRVSRVPLCGMLL